MTVKDISASEFAERYSDFPVGGQVVLLDVREAWEIEAASVDGATWIPMGDVTGRLSEIDAHLPIVVMCHGGIRSLQVAQYLAASGYEQVMNLAGGIDAWSREVDPGVPRY